jgi:small ligand-binding sensory domain FIST
MRWASALSREASPKFAIAEALDSIDGQLAGAPADVVFAFAYPRQTDQYTLMVEAIAERNPAAVLVGCSAAGVVGGGEEVEHEPAVSLTAAVLPGVEVESFHLLPHEIEMLGDDPLLWRRRLGVEPSSDPQFVLLPDPFTCNANDLLRVLDDAYPRGAKVGGLASGGTAPGENRLFDGGEVHSAGAVGLVLRGNVVVDTIVAQGCRPIGDPLFVTWAEDNILCQLEGRRATEVLSELYESLPAGEQKLFRSALHIGVVQQEGEQEYQHGDFLIRNVIGMDPESGVLAVGEQLTNGQVVQFHVRDARTSAADLETMLGRCRDDIGGAQPHGALLFSCLGRGQSLYGVPHHDSRLIAANLGPLPIGGFFCNGEIGPVGGHSFLHGYTSSIAVFRPRNEV